MIFAPLKKHHRTKVVIKKIMEIGTGGMMPIMSDLTKTEASTNAMHELLSTTAPPLAP